VLQKVRARITRALKVVTLVWVVIHN